MALLIPDQMPKRESGHQTELRIPFLGAHSVDDRRRGSRRERLGLDENPRYPDSSCASLPRAGGDPFVRWSWVVQDRPVVAVVHEDLEPFEWLPQDDDPR